MPLSTIQETIAFNSTINAFATLNKTIKQNLVSGTHIGIETH